MTLTEMIEQVYIFKLENIFEYNYIYELRSLVDLALTTIL